MKRKSPTTLIIVILALMALSCSLPSLAKDQPSDISLVPTVSISVDEPVLPSPPPSVSAPTSAPTTQSPVPTGVPTIVHKLTPSTSPSSGAIVYDVFSKDTAPEKRAPYGDTYKYNRLERPFKQDMTYVSSLDIKNFNLSEDADWYYISIKLIGSDPNNSIGINYGVEIDNDADGFGDIIIWAEPPYTPEWTNNNVQVYEDKNHDTAGVSALKSDAPIDTNGYESLLFDHGLGDDPDLAWIRINAGEYATVQFAFKKHLADGTFMFGVLSDAFLKDVGKLDYNDRFTAKAAGSPIRNNQYYPLGELYLFDNTCREAFGFKPTGYEPKICPRIVKPTQEPGEEVGCTNPSQYTDAGSCLAAQCSWELNPNIHTHVVFYCTYP